MLRRSNRLISEFLERRSLLASITWDGGGDGTSWSSANNWSTNSIPTSNDDVTINAGPALVNVNADAVAKSIQCSAPLSLSASLSVTNGATYHALFTWTQGALIGSHTFSAASDATFSGPGIKRMDDVVINQGELTYTGTNLQFSSATLTNSG
ncbi:MAG TPA: hypothetical protein PK402_13405, partial [Tepidisphaeraceae bacterium]|nr:hypothetical protein [Tepidisphaeraceae bacterium]